MAKTKYGSLGDFLHIKFGSDQVAGVFRHGAQEHLSNGTSGASDRHLDQKG
jgi:hypothetical protein